MEYHARCHCGRVRFSFRSSKITAGIRCNCSLCVRRGAVPGEDGNDRYRVNLGCVDGLDALALDITITDGKALPLADAPPT